MAFKDSELGTAVRHHPAEAKAEILAAYERAGASKLATAKALGVDVRTLDRWVAKLDLGTKLLAIKKKARKESAAE